MTIHQFLSADPQNVVAVHCMVFINSYIILAFLFLSHFIVCIILSFLIYCIKAGRGRTGTVIAAYFLYIKMFTTAPEALSFFAARRSATSEGVQVPSQKRYNRLNR